MEVLTEIVTNLLVIIIISSFLEMTLPEGNTKPFVHFAVGLFVLIAILSPTLNYLFDDKSFSIAAWNDQIFEQAASQIVQDSQIVEEQIRSQGNAVLKEKLAGQISAVAILVPGVDDVTAEVILAPDGNPRKVHLVVNTSGNKQPSEIEPINVFSGPSPAMSREEQNAVEHKIRQVMNNLYGLESEAIEITFEGG